MNKFTLGPWHRIDGDRHVYSASGTICKTPVISGGGSTARNWEANARLIAAAPKMYALLAMRAASGDNDCQDLIMEIDND
jgi:hypothetical protein